MLPFNFLYKTLIYVAISDLRSYCAVCVWCLVGRVFGCLPFYRIYHNNNKLLLYKSVLCLS